MAWDDPSPRARVRSPDGRPSAQPGYGSERVSFGRILFRLALAGATGMIACVATRAAVASLRGHAAGTDLVIALAMGVVVAFLAWRHVAHRAPSHGLSDRVRNGGGWFGGGSWGGSDLYPTFEQQIAVDLVEDVISVAIDIASD